jgi:hypothetical protein
LSTDGLVLGIDIPSATCDLLGNGLMSSQALAYVMVRGREKLRAVGGFDTIAAFFRGDPDNILELL